MVANLDLKKAKVVVEFGPGTGSVTKEIMSRLGSQTKFFAFETNENMVSILRRRFPTINVIHDSAENIDIHMKKRGIEQVDYIISSLPFTLFSPDLRIKIIEKSYTSLRPGGEFVAYQYLHAAFLAESVGKINTKTGFKSVVSSMALLNVPPAFVFRCKK
ncbi:MAG: methyltransferase domain-containing protein [Blastocatellia bacterium]|jgi:phospholipid N-methyltransferase|nr:methyltransferase domain-containing protein [Blastocatellia bacterium]